MNKNSHAIALPTLIVTVVILIILAGITINFSLGNNGIFKKSQDAIEKQEEVAQTEQQGWDSLSDIVANGGKGTNKEYMAFHATIPEGFYYVGGTESSGLVISDNSIDENKYAGQENVGKDLVGNQYVWVPVDGTNLKYQKHQYVTTKETDSSLTDTSSTPDTGNGNWRTYYYRMYTDWTDNGANAASVAKYGGFYIARYEAGYEEVTDGSTYKVAANKNTGSGVPQSKAGLACWNYVSQTNAKKLCQNINYTNATASLVDGDAWDTVMDWFTADGVNVNSSTSFGNYYYNRSTVPAGTIYAMYIFRSVKSGQTGSAAWLLASKYKEAEESFTAGGGTSITTLEGLQEYTNETEIDTTTYSYTTRLELTTGAVEDYKVKNIYDMAGNMWEWTTEEGKHNGASSFAVLCGGSFIYDGTTYPTCCRNGYYSVGFTTFSVGFRVSLYINV